MATFNEAASSASSEQESADPLTPLLPVVDAVLRSVARRYRLSRDDAQEFSAWVKLRLIEHDFAILRKFRGDSSPHTYLSVVVNRLFLDFRASVAGKFQPSVAARSMGDVGVELERLLVVQKHTLREACEILKTRGHAVSEDELQALALRLPVRRSQVIVVDPADLDDLAREPGHRSNTAEWRQSRGDLLRHLVPLLRELPYRDRMMIRMHFLDDVNVADIARTLKVDEQPLRRHLKRVLRGLREALEKRSIDASVLRDLFP